MRGRSPAVCGRRGWLSPPVIRLRPSRCSTRSRSAPSMTRRTTAPWPSSVPAPAATSLRLSGSGASHWPGSGTTPRRYHSSRRPTGVTATTPRRSRPCCVRRPPSPVPRQHWVATRPTGRTLPIVSGSIRTRRSSGSTASCWPPTTQYAPGCVSTATDCWVVSRTSSGCAGRSPPAVWSRSWGRAASARRASRTCWPASPPCRVSTSSSWWAWAPVTTWWRQSVPRSASAARSRLAIRSPQRSRPTSVAASPRSSTPDGRSWCSTTASTCSSRWPPSWRSCWPPPASCRCSPRAGRPCGSPPSAPCP